MRRRTLPDLLLIFVQFIVTGFQDGLDGFQGWIARVDQCPATSVVESQSGIFVRQAKESAAKPIRLFFDWLAPEPFFYYLCDVGAAFVRPKTELLLVPVMINTMRLGHMFGNDAVLSGFTVKSWMRTDSAAIKENLDYVSSHTDLNFSFGVFKRDAVIHPINSDAIIMLHDSHFPA